VWDVLVIPGGILEAIYPISASIVSVRTVSEYYTVVHAVIAFD